MKFEVITTMNKKLFDQVGKTMIDSFLNYWPKEITLTVYKEDEFELPESSRIVSKSILDILEYTRFVNRHKSRDDQSNPLELHKGAVRFAPKSFAIFTHCINKNGDFVIWLDADVETFRPINIQFLNSLVREGVYITFLGRQDNFTESGFLIFNTNFHNNENFMQDWNILYEFDQIFYLKEWHDCAALDWLRDRFLKEEEELNLSPWGKGFDHVFNNSVIGAYMDHMKGARKEVGHSYYNDLNLKIATPEAIERYSKWK